MPEDQSTPPPVWRLEVFDRAGKAILTLFKPVNGALTIQGDCSAIKDFVEDLYYLPRFFYPPIAPVPANPAAN